MLSATLAESRRELRKSLDTLPEAERQYVSTIIAAIERTEAILDSPPGREALAPMDVPPGHVLTYIVAAQQAAIHYLADDGSDGHNSAATQLEVQLQGLKDLLGSYVFMHSTPLAAAPQP